MSQVEHLPSASIVVTAAQLDALTDLLQLLPQLSPALLEQHGVACELIDHGYTALSLTPETTRVCPHCGSPEICYSAWVKENSNELVHARDAGPVDYIWCESCDTELDKVTTLAEWQNACICGEPKDACICDG